jgi:hypothetical protein
VIPTTGPTVIQSASPVTGPTECPFGQYVDYSPAGSRCVSSGFSMFNAVFGLPAKLLGIKNQAFDPTPIVVSSAVWLGVAWLLFRGKR